MPSVITALESACAMKVIQDRIVMVITVVVAVIVVVVTKYQLLLSTMAFGMS